MNHQSDAGDRQSPSTRPTHEADRQQRQAPVDDQARDPESPGATIDDANPAEPNEPGR